MSLTIPAKQTTWTPPTHLRLPSGNRVNGNFAQTPGWNQDGFVPSDNTNGLFVNRAQMLAVSKGTSQAAETSKAAAPDLAGAVKSHNYKAVAEQLAGLGGKERLKLLAEFRTKNPEAYKAMLADMRAGKIEDGQMKLGISLDRLSTTKWASKKEGKDIMKHLKEQYQEGRIVVSDGLDTPGLTTQDKADAKKSEAFIQIRGTDSNSPEATAALLAHEGQHSHRSHEGKRESVLKEEVQGNLVTAKVWKEFGKEKMDWSGAASYETLSKYDTYDKMMAHKVAPYMVAYWNKGEGGKTQARAMLTEFLKKDANLSKMADDDLRNLDSAARGMDAGLSGDAQKKVQAQIAKVEAEMSRRKLAKLED